jgi:hypothetical protein
MEPGAPSHIRRRRTLAAYFLSSTGGHALWETLQIPLYTIFWDSSPGAIAFALFHCTLGDLLIAGAALALASVLTRSTLWQLDARGPLRVALVTLVLGVVYTLFSEWRNTGLRANWTYTAAMPVLPMLGTGVTPVAQWLIVPLFALWITRRAIMQPADQN